MENYEDLEGKEVVVIDKDMEDRKGLVVGCDYDIGVTIVDVDFKDNHILCVNGPSSKRAELITSFVEYGERFGKIVKMLRDGYFCINELIDDDEDYGPASFETCSFI